MGSGGAGRRLASRGRGAGPFFFFGPFFGGGGGGPPGGVFPPPGACFFFWGVFPSPRRPPPYKGDKVGAYQSFEKGRKADVSCACHWTVGVAASKGKGRLYPDVYSVAPSGVFVPADSPVKTPEDLAGVPISVGYQSGSHYSTIQALEPYMPADKINLSFADGMLFNRLDNLMDGKSPASALFSGPYYLAEQLGFRKIIDTTFMITTMITGNPDPEDLRKFFRALKRAQRDIAAPPPPSLPTIQRISGGLFPIMGPRGRGAGRAHGVRALHQGGVRRDVQMDRRPRHFRGRPRPGSL